MLSPLVLSPFLSGSGFRADPDPLVRGRDPRIRIRIKISWIRNTGFNTLRGFLTSKVIN
jgi:hypothetical protein